MILIQIYIIVSVVLFAFLFAMWARSSWFNMLLKFAFLGATIVGCMLIFKNGIF